MSLHDDEVASTPEPVRRLVAEQFPRWDAVGNRTGVTQHAAAADGGNKTSTYAYPTPGGAAGSKPHAVTGVTTKNASGATTGISAFSYDQAGNMTGRTLAGQSAQTLTWDAEGELESLAQDGNGDGDLTDPGEKDTYLYSADGERLVRSQDGAPTLYLPGGMELTAYDEGILCGWGITGTWTSRRTFGSDGGGGADV